MKYHLLIVLAFSFFSLSAQNDIEKSLDSLLNEWHKAAAVADGDTFFGLMDEESVYIGTDKSERWDKPSFMEFAKPYFDRGRAWDFKPYDRQIIMGDDAETAWFSELLNTWMGVCRGSGILTMESDGWKIKQYHLSVTVPNEIIEDFIKLVEGDSAIQK